MGSRIIVVGGVPLKLVGRSEAWLVQGGQGPVGMLRRAEATYEVVMPANASNEALDLLRRVRAALERELARHKTTPPVADADADAEPCVDTPREVFPSMCDGGAGARPGET